MIDEQNNEDELTKGNDGLDDKEQAQRVPSPAVTKKTKKRMVEKEMDEFDALKMYCKIKGHGDPSIEIMRYPSEDKSAYVTVRIQGTIKNKFGRKVEKSVGRSAIGSSIDEAVRNASRELLESFGKSEDW